MAVGKNKRTGKGSKKKQKTDSFARKEWFRIRAPRPFPNRDMGWTCVNKSSGNKNSVDSLKGRVFEFHLGDLKRKGNGEDDYKKQVEFDGEMMGFRKMKLLCEEVKNQDVLTNFAGMDMTTEKLRDSIKKRATLIEAHEDVRTVDNYLLRVFCMARTARADPKLTVKSTSYAKASQVRDIRKRMRETMRNEINQSTLEEVVKKLIPNRIGEAVKKICCFVYPIEEVWIRKVKVLKRPAQDYLKIMALHEAEGNDEMAEVVDAPGDETFIP